ncbi:hypothetical protein [Mucilaginibacter sp.]|uniref:hypothetical protein n=1 Tax=Mucilaginibacter sp. TaxID=1882438 RepID=UPI00326521C9
MAFLIKEEFKTVIRDYQLDAITDGDDSIVDTAIEIAIEEVSSYFNASDKKVWEDGRPHYDVPAIFAAIGAQRNALMLANTKIVAIWYLLDLCNTGLEYDEAKDRYDRATAYLKALAKGDVNSATLPRLAGPPPEDELPYRFGSRNKFTHE